MASISLVYKCGQSEWKTIGTLMNNQKNNTERTPKPLIIRITAEDWQVSPAVSMDICQQPAKIFPWPLPPARRYPQWEMWQLGELTLLANQKPF
jgi:hypothetical protein